MTHYATQNGDTALMQARFNGHSKVVELLLRAGANPDLQHKVRTGKGGGVDSSLSNVNGLHASCETRSPR